MCRLEEVKRENHCLNAAMWLGLPALDKPLCKHYQPVSCFTIQVLLPWTQSVSISNVVVFTRFLRMFNVVT